MCRPLGLWRISGHSNAPCGKLSSSHLWSPRVFGSPACCLSSWIRTKTASLLGFSLEDKFSAYCDVISSEIDVCSLQCHRPTVDRAWRQRPFTEKVNVMMCNSRPFRDHAAFCGFSLWGHRFHANSFRWHFCCHIRKVDLNKAKNCQGLQFLNENVQIDSACLWLDIHKLPGHKAHLCHNLSISVVGLFAWWVFVLICKSLQYFHHFYLRAAPFLTRCSCFLVT